MGDIREVHGVNEILSSSESSDDDDIFFIEECINVRREIPKVQNYVEEVCDRYNEQEFKRFFRVSRDTSEYLINMFDRSEHCPRGPIFGGIEPKSAKEHILCYLWFAGNKGVYRLVSELFGVSVSTAHIMIERVIDFFVDDWGPTFIQFPLTNDDRQTIAAEFEQIAGYPRVCGAIDGTSIHIRTPAHKIKSTYVNRHDTTSLTLQAICDANLKFLDVFTGIPAKIHDARVFSLSFIRPTIMNMPRDYHLLGDSAYPICENIMTPYRDYGNMTDEEREYNRRFCATRVKIENAFGFLKGRFRQLIRIDMWRDLKASKFIISCCILHNLCIERDDFLEDIEPSEQVDEPEENIQNNDDRLLGQLKRNELAANFMEVIM